MHIRLFVLGALLLLVGFVTNAFAEDISQDPNGSMTRAEAVAVLVEAHPALKTRLEHHTKYAAPMALFDDVDNSQWYAAYIETAFEEGLITGNAERRFRPTDLLTEEEAIALGIRYYSMNHPEVVMQILSAEGSWFNVMVSASVQSGLDVPFPIRLGQPMKRSDIYALMASMDIQNPEQIAISHQNVRPVQHVTATVARPVIQQQNRTAQTQITPIRPPAQQVVQQQTTPPPTVPAVSAKPFSISMPTLGVKDLTITHPSDPFTKDGLHSVLKNGVGHLFSYPGKGGKILVYGHSSSYPWDVSNYTKIFRQINKLNVGEIIEVTYNGVVYKYEVTKKQTVPADDVSAYQQGGGEELILYTCWPPDSIKERYLVHAKPV